MRHYIIGTAGHVDHGKTTLIKALTGIDGDRLPEEKKRGITVDLGFAYIDLEHFGHVGIVDVPGHEKFVKNMLAGAPGMDLAMLVIAANEGIMPQTMEHMDILSVLKVKCGVIVITKTDLVSPEVLAMLTEDIKRQCVGTLWENSPIVPVSVVTKEGLLLCRKVLDDKLLELEADGVGEEDAHLPFMMPIDRVFTVKGFGTVVTGSVKSGTILSGNTYMLYPQKLRVSARNIQVHSKDTESAFTGQRTAVNLTGVSKEELSRGQILAECDSLNCVMMLDVKLTLLSNAPVSVKNNSYVIFYYGAAQYTAKVVLMDADVLTPGQSAFAQFRFKEFLCAREGDSFVIRFLSPLVTIGGGVIVDANPVKKKRFRSENIQGFITKESGSTTERIYELIREHYGSFLRYNELQAVRINESDNMDDICDRLLADGRIIRMFPSVKEENDKDARYMTTEAAQKLWNYFHGVLINYHSDHPALPGMPLSEAKSRLLGPGRDKDAKALLAYWMKEEKVKEAGGAISLFDFALIVPQDDELIRTRLLHIYETAGINPPAFNEVKPIFLGSKRFMPVLSNLLRTGELVKLNDRYIVSPQTLAFAREKLILMAQHVSNGEIILGEYRDRIKASRKVALAFLEYFDANKMTKKNGDIRTLLHL